VAGDAAIDGTGSHELLEICINAHAPAQSYIGETIGEGNADKPEGWVVEQDRIDRVQMCLDYIARRVAELTVQFPDAHVKVHAEQKTNVGGLYGRTDWWGTVDITISVFNSNTAGLLFLEICDYKDGRGWVSEKGNSQLQSYAAGQMRPYIGSGPELVRPFRTENIGGVRMSIVQPKTSRPIRYEDKTAEEVMVAVDAMAIAAFATDKPDAPLFAGDHCQWCPANPKRGGHCTAAAEQSLAVVKSMSTDVAIEGSLFENIGTMVADVKGLTSDQLGQMADAKSALMAAFDRVDEEIQSRLESGTPVSGYDMLPGRSSFVWNSSVKEIEKALKGRRLKLETIYPPKLITVSQMKKLSADMLTPSQKKRIEKDFVTEKIGKLSLQKVARKEKATSEELFADVPSITPPSFF
jgi:hypothetical protein